MESLHGLWTTTDNQNAPVPIVTIAILHPTTSAEIGFLPIVTGTVGLDVPSVAQKLQSSNDKRQQIVCLMTTRIVDVGIVMTVVE